MIELDIQNPNGFNSIPDATDLRNWSEAALEQKKSQDCSLVLRFVDIEESASLNHHYRQKNGATNVLSFFYDVPDFAGVESGEEIHHPHHLGDLVLCEPVVTKEAEEQNKSLQQHWAHLIIHGILHLQGFDHIEEKDALKMESLEIEILAQLGFSNPYQDVE